MKFVPSTITRSVSRKSLVLKKNSPQIFFVGGVTGVLASAVLACRATLRLEKTVHEIKTELQDVKEASSLNKLNEEEYIRNLTYVYTKSAVKLARLYGPSVLLGGVSIATLATSHTQLRRRNAALTFTLAAVSKAFDEYRIRMAEELGEERELEIYRDVRERELEVDGKKEIVRSPGPDGYSPYARIFDESSRAFEKNAEINHVFIKLQQNYANQRLHARGHVFLNEVYDSLGLEHTKAGAVVGWVRNGKGDNFVDFGLGQICQRDYYEPRIWLDFNVDGPILDLI